MQTVWTQIRPDKMSGLIWIQLNLFDTQMVFLKEFFEKDDFEKNQQMTKKREKIQVNIKEKYGNMFGLPTDLKA